MKTKILIGLLVLIGFTINAQNITYLVSSTGGNFQTNAQVSAYSFSPGDQIRYHRGEVFEGTLTPSSSGTAANPIVYGAYGTGDKPKISGSEIITGWTNHAGSIYKATVDETDITQLFLDDERMLLARYPDAGYFNTTSVSSTTTFTSTDLSGAISYTGATWIGRTSRYTMNHYTVASSSSQTVTLSTAVKNSLGVGEGFFLCNKLDFLTKAGEWYYDNAANTLYFWTPDSTSPAGFEVRVSTADYGISVTNKSYITFENLEISQSAIAGVYLVNGDYITIDSCNIISPDIYGINAPSNGSTNLTVTNNYIYEANSNAIRSYCPTSVFTGNTIEDTGVLGKLNKKTNGDLDNFMIAMYIRENANIIQYNNITNSGYNAIEFRGQNTMVKYNHIDSACMILDDGGGIYTFNEGVPTGSSGSDVMYNIIENVNGNTTGYAAASYGAGYGIYMDDGTSDIDILYNTVINCAGGYFSHINSNILFQYNTSFANLVALLTVRQNTNSYWYDNVVYGTDRTGSFVWWSDSYERLAVLDNATGVYDRNTYLHHYNTTPFRPGATQINFASWKSTTGQDANSSMDATTFTTEKDTIITNPSTDTKKIYINDATLYNYAGALLIGDSIVIPNYGSMIVIGDTQADMNLITDNSTTPPTPPEPEPPVIVPKGPAGVNRRPFGINGVMFGT